MMYDAKMNRYYTYEEYAELMGVKEETVRQWAHRGIIWVVKMGKRGYVPENETPVYRPNGRPKKREKLSRK